MQWGSRCCLHDAFVSKSNVPVGPEKKLCSGGTLLLVKQAVSGPVL